MLQSILEWSEGIPFVMMFVNICCYLFVNIFEYLASVMLGISGHLTIILIPLRILCRLLVNISLPL